MNKTTLGVLVGNRGFFPDALCREGREAVLAALKRAGIAAVALSPRDTKHGGVETPADARKCADLFRHHAAAIDGILITLLNFGDERAAADAVRWSGLQVPVLVHAFPDSPDRMGVDRRRDSFCGKISVCNNLRQYGIRYSLTGAHTLDPASPEFDAELQAFAAVCRVMRGLRGARIGAIGARPGAFKTVRCSEKLLEASGISVETVDLSDILGRCERLGDRDPAVRRKLRDIEAYVPAGGVPARARRRMARLAAVVEAWMESEGVTAAAVQCWTALEEYFGVEPCTVMSMWSQRLLPCACEVDAAGAVAMLSLRLASGRQSALLDWNNNFGDDPEACLPAGLLESPRMRCQEIIAGTVGRDNAFGTVEGRIRPGPFTFGRLTTDDLAGRIRGYAGERHFEAASLKTFGGYGVARIPALPSCCATSAARGSSITSR